ncbi:hypothetical protein ACFE04_029830 [Oxalis oulophora]
MSPETCMAASPADILVRIGELSGIGFGELAYVAFQKTLGVAKLLCCIHVTNTYLCTIALCYGPSMLPSINLNGDLVLAERISTRFSNVGSGDIVLLRSPIVPRKVVTKRVVGVEGDNVTYFVDPKNSDEQKTIVVPKGHVWVEGDYIYDSTDSRLFGPVPYGLLHARVFWRAVLIIVGANREAVTEIALYCSSSIPDSVKAMKLSLEHLSIARAFTGFSLPHCCSKALLHENKEKTADCESYT